jgi:hypothetical protein
MIMELETDKPATTHNIHNDVLVFRSNAAVGLIVSDLFAKPGSPQFTGAFLTPGEAREIAANLIRAAELAETTKNMTREEVEAWAAEHMPVRFDTSGSIPDETLSDMQSEVKDIIHRLSPASSRGK